MTNYTKKDLANNLSSKIGFSVSYSECLVNDIVNSMILEISNSNLSVKNFGVFKKIKKKERMGRNPKTKEEFKIYSRNSIKFTPSTNFKNFINQSQ